LDRYLAGGIGIIIIDTQAVERGGVRRGSGCPDHGLLLEDLRLIKRVAAAAGPREQASDAAWGERGQTPRGRSKRRVSRGVFGRAFGGAAVVIA